MAELAELEVLAEQVEDGADMARTAGISDIKERTELAGARRLLMLHTTRFPMLPSENALALEELAELA